MVTVTNCYRSLRPAQDAASVLQRYRQDYPGSKIGPLEASHGGPAPDGEDNPHEDNPHEGNLKQQPTSISLKLHNIWKSLPVNTWLNEEVPDFKQQRDCCVKRWTQLG